MKQPKRPPLVMRLKARLSANPKVNLTNLSIPLSSGQETPRLKDILETDVDEKYYLRNEIVEKIIAETDFTERLVSITLENKDGIEN